MATAGSKSPGCPQERNGFSVSRDSECWADRPSSPFRLELCTFTLAVALGAVLLLPFSIISNEVLLSLPRNYYIQWLNGSLIHGMWLDQSVG